MTSDSSRVKRFWRVASASSGEGSSAFMRSEVSSAAPPAAAANWASAQPLPFSYGKTDASTDGRPGPVSVSASKAAISVRLYS